MQETIPISKFKATCLRLLDNVKNGEIDHRNTQRGTDCTGHTTATTSQIGFMARLYERSHKNYRQYHITGAG